MTGPVWPWEANEDESGDAAKPKVEAGPTVQTEKLYRSHEAPAESTPEPPATIEPMSATETGVLPPSIEPGLADIPNNGWRTSIVFAVIFVITVGVGFLDMALNREFTYWTGAVFVVTCIVGAVKVRPSDLWTAVIIPPIAYLLALVIAGQPTTFPGTGSLLLREVSLVATGLAFNAPYIYGGTLAAFIIVLFRRSRIKKARAAI